MANYDPFMFSSLQGQQGGPGLRWEGKQKGISRDILDEWAKKQASKVSDAASGLSKAGLWSKGLTTLAMMHPKVKAASTLWQFLTGALVAGGTQKVLGDEAVSGLSMEDVPDVPYHVDEARELETTAHSAIDKILQSVNPSALQSAVTTPLSVLTMRNMQNPYGTDDHIKKFLKNKGKEMLGEDAYSIMQNRFNPIQNQNSLFDTDSWRNLFEIYKRGI